MKEIDNKQLIDLMKKEIKENEDLIKDCEEALKNNMDYKGMATFATKNLIRECNERIRDYQLGLELIRED